ncbi:MAG: NADAR family protein [Planctomycetota bacterium]
MITQFRNQYAFLSNFFPSPVVWEGIEYPTVEHAFQAAKTLRPEIRRAIAATPTPSKAKRAGGPRGIVVDFDQAAWDRKKIDVMQTLVRLKFRQNPELASRLLATGSRRLQEGNTWNDVFWGVCLKTGQGQNELGRILEMVRDELRAGVS